jgi:hypothetical protein
MTQRMSSSGVHAEESEDIESELFSTAREASSWHLAWPTAETIAVLKQEMHARRTTRLIA